MYGVNVHDESDREELDKVNNLIKGREEIVEFFKSHKS